jgi:hypothetical protein
MFVQTSSYGVTANIGRGPGGLKFGNLAIYDITILTKK